MKRVVLITGASAGIGRATAIRLAGRDTALALCARRKDRLDAAAADAARLGSEVLARVADVSNEGDMNGFVEATLQQFGRLDVVIANAGFGIYGAIDAIAPDDMRRLIDVNYMGTYYPVRAALPIFRRQQTGHVLIVSSIVGKRGVPYLGAYAATKFAQDGLAQCLRAELHGSQIHVTVVFPVSTVSEFFDVTTRESGPVTRAAGPRQTSEQVADSIARAIEHPVPEVYPYKLARGLVLLDAIAPGFCDRLVKKWGRKPV
jgi:short-subunit dehydrogenase